MPAIVVVDVGMGIAEDGEEEEEEEEERVSIDEPTPTDPNNPFEAAFFAPSFSLRSASKSFLCISERESNPTANKRLITTGSVSVRELSNSLRNDFCNTEPHDVSEGGLPGAEGAGNEKDRERATRSASRYRRRASRRRTAGGKDMLTQNILTLKD